MQNIKQIMTGGRVEQLLNEKIVELLSRDDLSTGEEELLDKMVDTVIKMKYA